MTTSFPGSNSRFDSRRGGKGASPYATYKRGQAPRGWTPWKGAREIWVDARSIITIGSAANSLPVSSEQPARQSETDGGAQSFDVSQDIVGGSISRKRNAPTEMTITLANDGDKYAQLFTPMDRIQLFLRRDETEYEAFTGYVVRSPYLNLITHQEITLECRCLIWRFIQKQWDPELPENIMALASDLAGALTGEDLEAGEGATDEDWLGHLSAAAEADPENEELATLLESYEAAREAEDTETMETLQGEAEGLVGAPTSSTAATGGVKWPDELLAYLLTDERHLGISAEMIKIQTFPEDWKERATQLTAEMDYCMSSWLDNINCPEGEGVGGEGECEDGGSSTVDGFPGCDAGQEDIAKWMGQESDSQGIPGALPAMVALTESSLNCDPGAGGGGGGNPALGMFQQTAGPDYGWGSEEEVMDPEHALGRFLEVAKEKSMDCEPDDCDCLAQWAQAVQASAFLDGSNFRSNCEAAQGMIGGSSPSGSGATPCGSGGTDAGKHGVEEESEVEAGDDPSRESSGETPTPNFLETPVP